ncbi:unnamed protein product, partial [Rotaria sp. Silwood2]
TVYISPALRQKQTSSDNNSMIELKLCLQSQLNRLNKKNSSSISIEIESIYRSQSRSTMNSCLYQLCHDSLLSSLSLTDQKVESYLLENFLQIFIQHINDEVSNKINDNLFIFISYIYAFYMTNGKIIFDIARYLLNIDQLNEKRLELILLLLKAIGFVIHKDDPLQLKTFLQELRTKCSSSTLLTPSSKCLEFMTDTIKSLKNNDVRELSVKDKTLDKTNILNVGLQDFLNVKEQERWWIVGSA